MFICLTYIYIYYRLNMVAILSILGVLNIFWFKCRHFAIKVSKKFNVLKNISSKYQRLPQAKTTGAQHDMREILSQYNPIYLESKTSQNQLNKKI